MQVFNSVAVKARPNKTTAARFSSNTTTAYAVAVLPLREATNNLMAATVAAMTPAAFERLETHAPCAHILEVRYTNRTRTRVAVIALDERESFALTPVRIGGARRTAEGWIAA